jgi:hypothetical protein
MRVTARTFLNKALHRSAKGFGASNAWLALEFGKAAVISATVARKSTAQWDANTAQAGA